MERLCCLSGGALAIMKKTCSSQEHLFNTYHELERFEEALTIKRYVYSERLKLNGEEHAETLRRSPRCYSLIGTALSTKAFRRNQVGAAQDDARGATRPR